ncbi:MAG: hypothetical protein KIH63_001140 [Candidatus Saccharibacteria bacterium]|nr:hypothetical protein [Candidatus Saccharibacteria bacterium]
MQPEKSNRNQKIIASLAIFAAMAIIVFGVSAFSGDSGSDSSVATATETETTLSEQTSTTPTTTEETTTTPANPPAASTVSPPAAATTKYKNGTYTATGSYSTPESTETISISLTVENDVVTATSAQNTAKDRESKEYQADFISGYKAQVIGKALASLNLGNVSGSSLTPIGFNNAVAKIRTQAQS